MHAESVKKEKEKKWLFVVAWAGVGLSSMHAESVKKQMWLFVVAWAGVGLSSMHAESVCMRNVYAC